MRAARALAAFIGIAILAMTSIAPAARAETAYRYWTYWQGNAGSWQFATQGSATSNPLDGAVEGWRFAITGAAGGPEGQRAGRHRCRAGVGVQAGEGELLRAGL